MVKIANLYKVIGIDALIKLLTILLSFILVPIILNLLNKEQYGVWVIFFSLLQWIAMFDFGIGNGLRNLLPKLIADNENHNINKHLFSCLILLMVFSGFGGLISYFFSGYIFNSNYFGLESSTDWFESSIPVFIMIFFTFLVISIIKPLAYVINKHYLVSLLSLIPNKILLFYCLYFKFINLNSSVDIKELLIVYLYSSLFSYLFVLIYIIKKNKYFFTGPIYFCKKSAKKVIGVSYDLFILQIAALFIYSMDNFIVANFFSVEVVSEFSVVVKLFSVYPIIIGILIGPLWNKITFYDNLNDIEAIVKLIRHYYYLYALSVILLLSLYVLSPFLLEIWVGMYNLSYYENLPFMLFNLTLAWGIIQSQILNAFNIVRIQWILALLTPFLRLLLIFIFVEEYNIGMESVMWAAFIVSLPITIISPILINNYLIKKLNN